MEERDFIEQATYFAKSEFVAELLKRLEERYISAWKTTQPADMTTRDAIYSMVRLMGDFKADMTTIASGLKVEAFNRRLAERYNMR